MGCLRKIIFGKDSDDFKNVWNKFSSIICNERIVQKQLYKDNKK